MIPIYLPEMSPSSEEGMTPSPFPDEEIDFEEAEVLLPTAGTEEGQSVERLPLLDLASAIDQIPSGLRKEMEDLLRADFREVIRWTPPAN